MFTGANGLPDPATPQRLRRPTRRIRSTCEIGPGGDLFYVDFNGGTIRRFQYIDGEPAARPPCHGATRPAAPLPLTVNFNGGGSSDPDAGDTLTYAWDLDGDGQFDDSTAVAPIHLHAARHRTVRAPRDRPPGRLIDERRGRRSRPATRAPGRRSRRRPLATNWNVGDTITFSGSATDAAGRHAAGVGSDVAAVSCTAPARPELPRAHGADLAGVACGSFVAPDHEYPSRLELRLTATDSGGLTTPGHPWARPRHRAALVPASPTGPS